MKLNPTITKIDPNTFEYQTYSNSDENLIIQSELDTVFSSSIDYIEYYIRDIHEGKKDTSSQTDGKKYLTELLEIADKEIPFFIVIDKNNTEKQIKESSFAAKENYDVDLKFSKIKSR